MTKMIEADTLKAWAAEKLDYWESRDDVPNSAAIVVIKDLLRDIAHGRLDASPPQGLPECVSSVTNCPVCGSRVGVSSSKEGTHHYVPLNAPPPQPGLDKPNGETTP